MENTGPYHVTSDPIDSDTENDNVPDGNERAQFADPNKIDTDGDTFNDGVEFFFNSTISGRESGIPSMYKDIDTSTSWNDRYWHGVWVGKKLVSNIDVDVYGYDAAGVKNIYVKVTSSNRFNSKEKSDNQNGYYFTKKFQFDFKLDSLVTEIWSGWDVRIEVADMNENIGYQEEHIKSGIQRLIDWAAEALKDLMDAILNWLWERITGIINFVLKPIRNAMDEWKSDMKRTINNAKSAYDANKEILEETKNEFLDLIHGNFYYIISGIAIGITGALIIVEAVTLGAATALSTAISVIAGVILGLIGAAAIGLVLDWNLETNPIRSAGDKAWSWYKEKASEQYQDQEQYFQNMFLDLFVIGLPIAFAALVDPTGLMASSASIIFSCFAMLFTTISSNVVPMLWIVGLTMSFLGFGFGMVSTNRATSASRTIGKITLIISGFGIIKNLSKLGGVV